MRGVVISLTKNRTPVGRIHYSAMPSRDPEKHPEWKEGERRKYTSQASWDREQEMVDEAGGGELVFADVLVTHWNKIVIEDPKWRPEHDAEVGGGFDHGKTNPTVLLRRYIDTSGVIVYAGEYYQPGREIWQHAPMMKQMYDFTRMETIVADSAIFNVDQQQEQRAGHAPERARSFAELYYDAGIESLYPYRGDKSDVSFASRLMEAWKDLENREASVKILCPRGMYVDAPVPGLNQWGCPNLLWELMHIRRVKLTAQQLLSRNVSEAIVDKDNHGFDAMKYDFMSRPDTPQKPFEQRVAARAAELQKVDPTLAAIKYRQIVEEEREEEDLQPFYYGGNARRRIQQIMRLRRRNGEL